MVKTGVEFDAMSDEEIDNLPTLPFVIARCAPDTKTKMIMALRRRNRYSAMTGDGVNDAPSLSEADVGIAMGMSGSDVAKSASAIVLTDDNFASIVNAIEEGRRMFDNIQKFILHLLVSNVGEVILLIIGLAFQDENRFSVFPLAPLEILWINMITSSFPAFGLGLEDATADIMRRDPHDNKKGVFTTQILVDMLVYGTIMGACSLCTFVIVVYGVGNGSLGRSKLISTTYYLVTLNANHISVHQTVMQATVMGAIQSSARVVPFLPSLHGSFSSLPGNLNPSGDLCSVSTRTRLITASPSFVISTRINFSSGLSSLELSPFSPSSIFQASTQMCSSTRALHGNGVSQSALSRYLFSESKPGSLSSANMVCSMLAFPTVSRRMPQSRSGKASSRWPRP